jgi:hypothetical protein
VSGLWTPSGTVPDPDDAAGGATGRPLDGEPAGPPDDDVAEELARVRAELAQTPVADLIANHAIGLWQLAILHLTPEPGAPARLDEAGLAIDAMAALVEGVGSRLGPNAEPLQEALTQLRLAFVQVSGAGPETPAP